MLRPRSTVRPPWLLLAGCGVLVAACAGRRTPSEDLLPRELLVEVLPPGAEVSLDGRPLGAGSRAIPAPPAGEHLLRIEADGYEPAEQTLPEGSLAGVRVAAALRPVGLWSALDYDDPETLALAAAHLVRLGSAGDAAAYAERAIALERETALAHRALGDARAALGDARRAAAAWAEYLRLAPDAPDAAAVAERVDAVRVEAALPAR